MKAASLPYHQRLNKNIDRQILIDLLFRISSYKPIREYSYIGFGGPFLEDFKLIHNLFEIRKMYSFDLSSEVVNRQEYNKPASCISCINTTSGNMIDNFPDITNEDGDAIYNIHGSVIAWLDYTAPKEVGNQLSEFSRLIEKVEPQSVIKITLNATASGLLSKVSLPPLPSGKSETPLEKQERLKIQRMDKLKTLLGTFFQEDISTPEKMVNNYYPDVLFETVLRTAHKSLEGLDRVFKPLCAYKYADGQQMLTITGIILQNDDVTNFNDKTSIDSWPHFINEEQLEEINVPFLSISEKLLVDKHLPSNFENYLSKPQFYIGDSELETQSALKNYEKYYRFYPNFSKVWI